jgi:hypothetical protein
LPYPTIGYSGILAIDLKEKGPKIMMMSEVSWSSILIRIFLFSGRDESAFCLYIGHILCVTIVHNRMNIVGEIFEKN